MTAPDVLIRSSAPANPAGISKDASLADLALIKKAWAQSAQEAGFPDMLWEVLAWLGQPVRIGTYDKIYWRGQNVGLLGGETPVHWSTAYSTFVIERRVSAYIGSASNAAEMVAHNPQVARWAWRYVEITSGKVFIPLENEDNLFIPGLWINRPMAALPDAKAAAKMKGSDTQERARRNLLSELLVGLDL